MSVLFYGIQIELVKNCLEMKNEAWAMQMLEEIPPPFQDRREVQALKKQAEAIAEQRWSALRHRAAIIVERFPGSQPAQHYLRWCHAYHGFGPKAQVPPVNS
jgi:hypothetical protein